MGQLQLAVSEHTAPLLEHVPRPSDEVGLEEGETEAEMEGELLPVTDGDWLLVTDGGDDSSKVGLTDADTDGGWLATVDGELLPVTEGLDDPVTDGLWEGPGDGLLVTQMLFSHVSPRPSQPQTKWQVKSPWHDPTQQPLSLTQSVGWLHWVGDDEGDGEAFTLGALDP